MDKPLAYRMRPTKLEDIIGQQHLVGEKSVITRMIKANRLSSLIMTGPPGIGKTSIARAISGSANLKFFELNAVSSGKKDIEKIVKETSGETVILYIDELHQYTRVQQDALLQHVEDGTFILIGSTTESVMHNIVPALRSRCQIFQLQPLSVDEIKEGLERALSDSNNGLGNINTEITEEAMEYFIQGCGGDLRAALNALEMAVLSTEKNEEGTVKITLKDAEHCLQKKSFLIDRKGTQKYNIISALQKSIRGSDLDASYFYAAMLIEAGDLKTLVRRLLVTLYEDNGLAMSPEVVSAVAGAIKDSETIGLPESRICLAYAIAMMCLSPKSNSAYKALDRAIEDVRKGNIGEIPMHLRDAHYKGARELGNGVGYIYPHDEPGFVKQQYLPDNLIHKQYYEPKKKGNEELLALYYERINELKNN